jgi:hypothetical protein
MLISMPHRPPQGQSSRSSQPPPLTAKPRIGRQLINWTTEIATASDEQNDWNKPGRVEDFGPVQARGRLQPRRSRVSRAGDRRESRWTRRGSPGNLARCTGNRIWSFRIIPYLFSVLDDRGARARADLRVGRHERHFRGRALKRAYAIRARFDRRRGAAIGDPPRLDRGLAEPRQICPTR